MRKMFNRLVCIFTFITDIPVVLLMMIVVMLLSVLSLTSGISGFKQFWRIVIKSESWHLFKKVYYNLWQSFKDGKLYSTKTRESL